MKLSARARVRATNAASIRWKTDTERRVGAALCRLTHVERHIDATRYRLGNMERREGSARCRLSNVERRMGVTERLMREMHNRMAEVVRGSNSTGIVGYSNVM